MEGRVEKICRLNGMLLERARVRANDDVNRPSRQHGGRRRSVIRPKGGYLQIVPAGSELNGVLGEIVGGTTGNKSRVVREG